MNSIRPTIFTWALVGTAAMSFACFAQQATQHTQQQDHLGTHTQQHSAANPHAARDASRQMAKQDKAIRISKLTGMSIENNQGESIGTVDDVVIDPQQGQVRYLAVSYGGLLGIGDELHAVPFKAFECGHKDGYSERVLKLDVNQDQLADAEGFDQDNWPNVADHDFEREMNRRYKIDDDGNRKEIRETSERHTRDDVRDDRSDATAHPHSDSYANSSAVRASKLIGKNIHNRSNENVGEINDIVVGQDGKIRYAAVTYDKSLWSGSEMHAVPFHKFQMKTDPEDADHTLLILDGTQEQLEGAEGFDDDSWPDFADNKVDRSEDGIRSYTPNDLDDEDGDNS